MRTLSARVERTLSSPELMALRYDGMLALAQRVQIALGATALIALWAFPGVAPRNKLAVTAMLLCIYLPWTILNPRASKLLGPSARTANVVMDLLAIGSFALVVPETRVAVMTAFVLMVAFHAMVHGRAAGLVVSAGVLAIGALAEFRTEPDLRANGFTIVLYAAVLIGMSVMVDGLARERRDVIRHLARLHGALEAVCPGPELQTTLDSVASAARAAVGATYVAVFVRDDAGKVSAVATAGHTSVSTEPFDAIGAAAMASGEPVEGVPWMVAVPLGPPDAPLGVLDAFWDEADNFEDADVALLAAYARRVGLEVARAVAFEREREAASQLAEADALKSEFVARVSHELRTPLTAISGFISTVLLHWDSIDDASKRDLLERAQANSGELRRMVEQVLVFSRSGEDISVTMMPCALAAEVDVLIGRLLPVIGDHTVDVDVHPSLVVITDREALHHVVSNLLSNAAKFTPPGSTIHVSARREGDEVVVSVRDEGPGIADSDRSRIFDRFYRGSSISARGTGIGLSIVRNYVERLGGRVWVVSSPGNGATFSFTLPAASAGEPVVLNESVAG